MSPLTEAAILNRLERIDDTLHGDDGAGGIVVRIAKLETRMALLMWSGGLVVSGLVGAWTTAVATGLVG